jgi:streptogramin lyase
MKTNDVVPVEKEVVPVVEAHVEYLELGPGDRLSLEEYITEVFHRIESNHIQINQWMDNRMNQGGLRDCQFEAMGEAWLSDHKTRIKFVLRKFRMF